MDIQISDADDIKKDILNLSRFKGPPAMRNVIVSENEIDNQAGSNHRRAGSTGTISTGTGSGESFTTTDDETEGDIDRHKECPIKNHRDTSILSATDTTIISPSDDARLYSYLEAADLDQIDDGATIDQFDVDTLRYELRKARASLRSRGEEVARLSKIRQDVANELEDLTASLFQEAHNMVRVANEKQAAAEKASRESQLKVDLLSAEVSALKTLVLTSTPSAPNKHLHPQIDQRQPSHKHRRCSSTSSHFNQKYGRPSTPPPDRNGGPSASPAKGGQRARVLQSGDFIVGGGGGGNDTVDNGQWEVASEVDPVLYEEFIAWKRNVPLCKGDSAFMRRIYSEDVDFCLEFVNKELAAKVVEAVENGSILVEAIGDKSKTIFPKKCALMDVQRHCHYRMNTCTNAGPSAESDTWHFISMNCRNRIIAVCDFRNYLKYIERGLVKSPVHDIYWEIVKLRKDMMLARLGLTPNSSH